jgi:hypothetical protein
VRIYWGEGEGSGVYVCGEGTGEWGHFAFQRFPGFSDGPLSPLPALYHVLKITPRPPPPMSSQCVGSEGQV